MPKPKSSTYTATTKASPKKPSPAHKMQSPFSKTFPAIAYWVTSVGWIEIGDDAMSPTWIRALDQGGLIWESGDPYASVDEALHALDTALRAWLDDNDVDWLSTE